jgi:hypothetical protein
LPLKQIKEIKKKQTLGFINNSIELKVFSETTKKLTSYIFTSFASRNTAYKRISLVWKNYQRTFMKSSDKNYTSDTESSQDDETESNLQNNRSLNLSEMNTSVDMEKQESGLKEEIYFPPNDPEKSVEGCKVLLRMTTQAFYDKFLKDQAEFSFDNFYQNALGHFNLTVSEWKELNIENELNQSIQERPHNSSQSSINLPSMKNESNGQPINGGNNVGNANNNTWLREINFLMKLKDTPFVNQTRVIKNQKLKKEGEKFILMSSSTGLDTPYCSYYACEDTWEIMPYDTDKCVLR